ncbi:MAG: hypothetical protein AABW54_04160 [Candidatus Micrarchaeota archaeon]
MADTAASIETALAEFFELIHKGGWQGRENEAVNLFAHSCLNRFLDIERVGIEVAVKNPFSDGKLVTRKDLVVWPKPRMTCWNSNGGFNTPDAVVEWKYFGPPKRSNASITEEKPMHAWLQAFSNQNPRALGYAVVLDNSSETPIMRVTRYLAGEAFRQVLGTTLGR